MSVVSLRMLHNLFQANAIGMAICRVVKRAEMSIGEEGEAQAKKRVQRIQKRSDGQGCYLTMELLKQFTSKCLKSKNGNANFVAAKAMAAVRALDIGMWIMTIKQARFVDCCAIPAISQSANSRVWQTKLARKTS